MADVYALQPAPARNQAQPRPAGNIVRPKSKRTDINNARWTIGALCLFLLVVSLAIFFPSQSFRVAVATLGSLAPLIILGLVLLDYWRSTSATRLTYTGNLRNTIGTGIIAIPLITWLYCGMWYHYERSFTLQLTNDLVTQIQFPNVAVFQQLDFSSQANILPGLSKCFLGWYDDSAPKCSTLQTKDIDVKARCNCNESWSSEVIENFNWQGTTYRYLQFQTQPNLVSNQPTYLMMLQVFFNFNASKAQADSSFTPSPSLSIAVYDPSVTLLDALNNNYTRFIDINALGTTSANLGIVRRQLRGEGLLYDYDIGISSIPTRDLVCNTAENTSYPCVSILRLSFSTFTRTNYNQKKVMEVADALGSAGAYYSIAQILGWIFSGLAWTP